MTSATIAEETPQQPDVERLLCAADLRSASLYPIESRHGSAVDTLLAQGVCFLVARLDGAAVGCGGYVRDGHNDGELKRIFVDAEMRGYGVGRLILTTLERTARERGIVTMRLETGLKSTEALGLYRRFGYRARGPFGRYTPDPLSVFMEKTLP